MEKVFILGYCERNGLLFLVATRGTKLVYLPLLNEAADLQALKLLDEAQLDQARQMLAIMDLPLAA